MKKALFVARLLPALALLTIGGCREKEPEPPPEPFIVLESPAERPDEAPLPPVAPLTGVNAGPRYVDDAETIRIASDEYTDLGVTGVRTHDFNRPFDVSRIFPNFDADPSDPASYNFTESDEAYQAIIASGCDVYLRIGESWCNPIGCVRLPTDTQWENWLSAVMHIVRHYNNDFNNAVPIARAPAYVELWNEADSERFWDLGIGRFVDFFVLTVQAINAEYPGLKVGGPGFTSGALDHPSEWVEPFFNMVVAYPGVAEDKVFDFVSWHVYDHDPVRFGNAADYYTTTASRLIGALPTQSFEQHITEWNTQTDTDTLRSRGRGAAEMTAAWIVLQEHGVDRSFFYRGIDTHESDGGVPSAYGLLTILDAAADEYEKKAIGSAFKLWSEFAAGGRDRLHVTTGVDEEGGFYALARYADSGYLVILANLTAADQEWQIELPEGDRLAEAGDLTVKGIDPDGNYEEPTVSLPMTIKANSVQLVAIGK